MENDKDIRDRLRSGESCLALVGLGYVGLPLAMAFASRIKVIGFDVNEERLSRLREGIDPCGELPGSVFEGKSISFTSDPERLREASFYIVAVPTPIDRHNQPDLEPLLQATHTIGRVLKPGDYVVYESTVYPGCTEEDCLPILERLSSQAEKLKKIKGGTDRLIRIRMKQLEQRLSGAKQSDPHVYDKYV